MNNNGEIFYCQMRCFILYFFIGISSVLYAQNIDIEHIKQSSLYWSAEGRGTTIEEADKDALSKITKQIEINLSDKTSLESQSTRTEQGVVDYRRTFSESVKSISFVSLQNVEMLVLEPEPNAKVFRWVAKSEVDKMFEERKNKIIDFVKTGKIAEQKLQIGDALRNYYWALMLAKVNRDAVYADFNGENMNVLTFLPQKIKSVISHVKAEVQECINRDNRYYTQMHFTYDGRDVAGVQLRYFDGQSFIGPLTVKDGLGELELVALPIDNKIKIRYEYSYRNEAENLDAELRAIFSEVAAVPIQNALTEIPVKVDVKKNTMVTDTKKQKQATSQSDIVKNIPTESICDKELIEFSKVEDSTDFADVLEQVENAIRQGTPEIVYTHFTPEGYKLFETLLKRTGRVSLVGNKQNYEFFRANGQILGRFCKVKIKFKNGKAFMENLVFRFNEDSKKIQSIALALSRKAEEDIFNAAAKWTEISRFTILQFMEDYQTAYSLKRLDYLEKVFSDEAIIITGTVLNTASNMQMEGIPIELGHNNIRFNRQSKQQYLSKLRQHFKEREYIHLTFEDNVTKVINAPRIPQGTAFAIQINQIYNSPIYSDRGYLTLVLDTQYELPVIYVRLWQPEKNDMLTLEQFMNKFEF